MESTIAISDDDQVRRIRLTLSWIILISAAIRMVLALTLELGNDEVYYWTYALYPDLSHFDHPPMVGLVIQLFTLNGMFKDDFFLRLGPILFSAVNTWLLFSIVKKIADERAGLYAAFLFNSSLYFSIISGFAIVPDAPLIFFWLISLSLLLVVLPAYKIERSLQIKMMLFGLSAGLAIVSKYQGVFIWIGALLYIIFYNQKWLKDYSFYTAGFITILVASPILIWNIQNDFISVAFHGERVTPSYGIRLDFFFRELLGQIAYQNPLNVFVFVPVVITLFKRESFMDPQMRLVLLFNGLPLWMLFTGFSLFRSTLPHWTGPAFLSLIIMSSIYWSGKAKSSDKKLIPIKLILPAYFLAFLLAVTVYLINYSPFHFGNGSTIQLGENDFAQDMYGWKAIGQSFQRISIREEKSGNMAPNSDLISFRWFPGSHLDFYAAYPSGRKLFLIGDLKEIHKYAWINEYRGGLIKGNDYYYIAPSNYYRDPRKIFGDYFAGIDPIDTIKIERGRVTMRYAFLYRLKGYKGNFETPIHLKSASK